MTTKKYILTFVIFFVLLATAPILFFLGLSFKENSAPIFYVFATIACISLISAITFIAHNYKKLVSYDVNRIENKFKTLDFSIIEESVGESKIYEKLKNHGYTKNAENMFHKKVEEDVGDGGIVVSHYYAAIFQSDKIIDVQDLSDKFNKETVGYNIGYIFLNKNIDSNFEMLKQYVKEVFINECTHVYKRKKFFVPIIISDEKIFYLKAGSFMSEYRHGLSEGLRILIKRK